MSVVREVVVWYKDLKQIWPSQDFELQLKIQMCPIALLSKAAGLLCNLKTCIHRVGKAAIYFCGRRYLRPKTWRSDK